MPCSTASRSWTSSASSPGSRPRVWRFSRRTIAMEATTPSTTASAAARWWPPAYGARGVRSRRASATGDQTSPMMVPLRSNSGTLPRADRPSVPRSMTTTSCPDRAADGSVLTFRPISARFGWASRMPRRSVTTTKSAPVAWRIRSARCSTTPWAVGHRVGDDRVGGDGTGERQRAPAVLAAKLIALDPGGESVSGHGDQHHDADLQNQQLGERIGYAGAGP